ncbi:MAG: NADPH:quinone oxidoreductase family protein [Proteobacteria bacterium]|nr:NADPH:quinone oxidoreductase family protein [Pseudomonadota bacterium]
MHAWQFDEYGHYDNVLKWVERPTPKVGDGEALIETVAVSLNFPDLLITQGMYQNKAPLPAVPGVEAVGKVVEVGRGSKFKLGERAVGFMHSGGTLADYFIAANDSAWPVPAHVSDVQAAGLSVTYGTSYFGLKHRGQLAPGEVLLVLGAAGGVGSAAIQLGKVFGATVIAAAGSAEKLDICRKLGADHVINYKDEDVVEKVKEFTDGRGADVIYDPIGGDLFDQVKRCVNWEGRIVIIGFASGRIPSIECNRLLLKNMSVVGLAWGQYLSRNPAKGEACQMALYDLLADGKIDPLIYRVFGFADLPAAMALMESRELYGKVVITR